MHPNDQSTETTPETTTPLPRGIDQDDYKADPLPTEPGLGVTDGVTDKSLSTDELRAVVTRPGVITIVSMFDRLGWKRFAVSLEYDHFTPATPKNKEFEFALMKWPHDDMGMYWNLVTVPESYLGIVDELLKECELHRTAEGAAPMVIGGGKAERFPIEAPNVFFVESNAGAAIYGPDRAAKMEEEQNWALAKFAAHEAKLAAEFPFKEGDRVSVVKGDRDVVIASKEVPYTIEKVMATETSFRYKVVGPVDYFYAGPDELELWKGDDLMPDTVP